MQKLEILSVNISEKKGIVKTPVEQITINETGIVGDAHAGIWHRQVSLLAQESIDRAEEKAKAKFPPGTFAENLTTRGVELAKTSILDRFISDEVELEVTQIGKKCHSQCAIGQQIGDCIMPAEGIFCRTIKGGVIKAGTQFQYIPRIFKVKIVVLSDRASAGVYEDKSGKLIDKLTSEWFASKNMKAEIETVIIPDEKDQLKQVVTDSFSKKYDIIFTTGSTGIGERDIAPETIRPMLEKEITGIMELVRVKYGMKNPNAVLSRSIAGTKDKTLLFALPGNPKAVNEYLTEIFSVLFHSLLMIHGINGH
jgi:molybdopterin adenylyltransferase